MGYKLKRILIYPDGVTEKQVYPAGWKPGENTVAYYPLTSTSTVNDMKGSGTIYNLTNNNSVQFGTYGGVNCAYFDGTNKYLTQNSINMGLFGGNITVSYFAKVNTSKSGGLVSIWYGKPYNGFNTNYNGTTCYYDTANNTNITTYKSFTIGGERQLFTFTWTGTDALFYINGELVQSISNSIPTGGNGILIIGAVGNDVDGWRAYLDGYIRDIILENKARTAEEISNYYNLTKSTYGL